MRHDSQTVCEAVPDLCFHGLACPIYGGKAGNPIAWSNYGKILQRANDNTYDCNFIGGWGANAINLFRLTIKEDNTVDMVGYYGNYSWTLTNTDGTVSTYDPETKSFDLKYTVITNARETIPRCRKR